MPRKAAPFWSRVDRSGDCWLWTGARNEDGYGGVRFRGRTEKAHRVAWILTHGEIPTETPHVLHRCDNPPCCRPEHLFLGTNGDNVCDRHTKGRSKNLFPKGSAHPARQRNGERHWCAKLTDNDVKDIRRLFADGSTQASIAKSFNVHSATISRIVRHEWRGEVQ